MALLTFLIMQNDLNDVGTESVANSFCHSKSIFGCCLFVNNLVEIKIKIVANNIYTYFFPIMY